MGVSVEGVLVLVSFYLFVLLTGVLAAWWYKRRHPHDNAMETSLVAGRSLKGIVSVFTMMATTVGGGYINGTAESVATAGLVWTLAPFGIFIGLNIGGLVYARRMREKKHVTMLDPIQQTFGRVPTGLVYLASLSGDLLWTAAILSALGSSLSVIAGIPRVIAVCASSAVTILYTLVGNMVAVAYTDVLQLILIFCGLTLSLPFVMTNDQVGHIEATREQWIGKVDWNSPGTVMTWVDLLFAMSLGTIPWQAYFQRVLSVHSAHQAVLLSVVGAFGAVVFAVPSVLIGAVATSANWTGTEFGRSPLPPNGSEASLVLPLVLKEFTPPVVSALGLGAISAAVMSSMDSAILGSSAMFTHNIYRGLFRHKASDKHLMIVQRVSILCVGVLATAISLAIPVIYGIFILAADIVYVIVLPQLTYSIFLPHRGSGFGAVAGFLVGAVMRLGAGEPTVGLQPFIHYSTWNPEFGQSFPFRTTAMLCSGATIVLVSEIVRILRQRNCGRGEGGETVSVVNFPRSSGEERGKESNEAGEQESRLLCTENGHITGRNDAT
ncbi:high-affinity choline transporter 1-like [Littorina saxatilis]|uniref:Uncharacterized protein n=1 Tax=Littorina saxatilis TaxID=31220 RepID=A0AAN9BHE0_9CAEN